MSELTHSFSNMSITDVAVIVLRNPPNVAAMPRLDFFAGAGPIAFTLESYKDVSGLAAAPLSSSSFTMVAGERRSIDFPESGNVHHSLTRLVVTSGRLWVDAVSSFPVMRSYMEQPENPPRIDVGSPEFA